jgi:pentatricopeptide repeat protein
MSQALKYFEAMKAKKIPPTPYLYTTIIDGFASEDDYKNMKKFFAKMTEDNLTPDVPIYNVFIKFFVNKKDEENTLKYYEALKAASLQPDTSTLNLLIQLYASLGKVTTMEELFEQMKDKVKPNRITYTTLIEAFHSAKDNASMAKYPKTAEAMDRIKLYWRFYRNIVAA